MILVQIKGGLGNQLFQYAAGRALAERLNVSLELDTTFYDNTPEDSTPRTYELDKLQISASVLPSYKVEKWRGVKVRESYYPLITPFLKKSGNYYLRGYWQSESYFKKIAPTIRQELTFRKPLNGLLFDQLRKEIQDSESISLHFRRGDYISNPKVNAYHGALPLSYYQEAVNFLQKRLDAPKLFLFSDDMVWVKQNFYSTLPTIYVDESDEEQHSDFRLMTLCKHHIIANSSYSWWAAWLNANPNKKVVAPKLWSPNIKVQRQSLKMIPKEWIRI